MLNWLYDYGAMSKHTIKIYHIDYKSGHNGIQSLKKK